jgi:hypothetical protein
MPNGYHRDVIALLGVGYVDNAAHGCREHPRLTVDRPVTDVIISCLAQETRESAGFRLELAQPAAWPPPDISGDGFGGPVNVLTLICRFLEAPSELGRAGGVSQPSG